VNWRRLSRYIARIRWTVGAYRKRNTMEALRVIHAIGNEFGDALRARSHRKYVKRFFDNALAMGLAPGSPAFMDYTVRQMIGLNCTDVELQQFYASLGVPFDAEFVGGVRELLDLEIERRVAEIEAREPGQH
jgi:hypothetical protein